MLYEIINLFKKEAECDYCKKYRKGRFVAFFIANDLYEHKWLCKDCEDYLDYQDKQKEVEIRELKLEYKKRKQKKVDKYINKRDKFLKENENDK